MPTPLKQVGLSPCVCIFILSEIIQGRQKEKNLSYNNGLYPPYGLQYKTIHSVSVTIRFQGLRWLRKKFYKVLNGNKAFYVHMQQDKLNKQKLESLEIDILLAVQKNSFQFLTMYIEFTFHFLTITSGWRWAYYIWEDQSLPKTLNGFFFMHLFVFLENI